MRTVGSKLDHEQAKSHMDSYFERMGLMRSQPIASRIKFMIDDIVELRSNNWEATRTAQKNSGPKTLDQIRLDAQQEQVDKAGNRKDREAQMQTLMAMKMKMGLLGSPKQGSRDTKAPQVNRPAAGLPAQPGMFAGMTRRDDLSAIPQGYGDQGTVTHVVGKHDGPPLPKGMLRVTTHNTTGGTMSLRPDTSLGGGDLPVSRQKGGKKKAPKLTAEELEKKTNSLLNEFLSVRDIGEASKCVQELKSSRHMPRLVSTAIMLVLDKTDGEREAITKLLTALAKDSIVRDTDLVDGINDILNQLNDLVIDIPMVNSHFAYIIGGLVSADAVRLNDLVSMFRATTCPDAWFGVLKITASKFGEVALMSMVSKFDNDFSEFLAESKRSEDDLVTLATKHELLFLFPILRLKQQITEQLNGERGGNSSDLREFLIVQPESVKTNPRFLGAVAYSIFKYCYSQETPRAGLSGPEKAAAKETDRKVFNGLASVLKSYTEDNNGAQVQVAYALQQFCFDAKFPSGAMLRYAQFLYDDDLVEEDAWFTWREDINDEYQGKGDALIAVNAYLNWMREAPEESSEEDDEDEDED